MRSLRSRLTYSNVMSTLAVFLVLGGGAAFAAIKLPKNSVGTKQIKKKAVKTAKLAPKAVKAGKLAPEAVKTGKIAKSAVSTDRIADAAVTNGKLAAGAVSGDKINVPTTPFSRVVARLGGGATVAFAKEALYPLVPPTYIQPAGETDQYIAGLNVNFQPSCTPPRAATAYLLLDAANPGKPTVSDIIGLGQVVDEAGGQVTKQLSFGSLPGAGAPWRTAPAAATPHTFSILMASSSCTAGSGITASGGAVDIIGTR